MAGIFDTGIFDVGIFDTFADGAIAGSADFTFTSSLEIIADGTMSLTGTLTFSPSVSIIANGIMSGTATLRFANEEVHLMTTPVLVTGLYGTSTSTPSYIYGESDG